MWKVAFCGRVSECEIRFVPLAVCESCKGSFFIDRDCGSNAPGQRSATGVTQRFLALASEASGQVVAEFGEESAAIEAGIRAVARLELAACS